MAHAAGTSAENHRFITCCSFAAARMAGGGNVRVVQASRLPSRRMVLYSSQSTGGTKPVTTESRVSARQREYT